MVELEVAQLMEWQRTGDCSITVELEFADRVSGIDKAMLFIHKINWPIRSQNLVLYICIIHKYTEVFHILTIYWHQHVETRPMSPPAWEWPRHHLWFINLLGNTTCPQWGAQCKRSLLWLHLEPRPGSLLSRLPDVIRWRGPETEAHESSFLDY